MLQTAQLRKMTLKEFNKIAKGQELVTITDGTGI